MISSYTKRIFSLLKSCIMFTNQAHVLGECNTTPLLSVRTPIGFVHVQLNGRRKFESLANCFRCAQIVLPYTHRNHRNQRFDRHPFVVLRERFCRSILRRIELLLASLLENANTYVSYRNQRTAECETCKFSEYIFVNNCEFVAVMPIQCEFDT